MRKKLFIPVALAVCIAVLASVMLVACNDKPPLIVYLGDSIAEGIAGASSPFPEREKNAYYGVLSIRNKLEYQNRSVSGNKTGDMLSYIKEKDKDAKITETYLRKADIIHISILGNDFLLENVSELLEKWALYGDDSRVDTILAQSIINFGEIIATLKELNPAATIMVLKVYNPMYDNCPILDSGTRDRLVAAGLDAATIREKSNHLLVRLNQIIVDYDANHPGDIEIIEVDAAFEAIFSTNPERGKFLIYSDGVHPSPEGHAVIADTTQKTLERMGFVNAKTAIKEYKKLRNEQLDRLFSGTSVDVKAVKKSIDKANNCEEITLLYFNAIRDVTPIYY